MNEEQRIAEVIARHQMILLRMAVRVTIYYALLAGAVALAVNYVPGFSEQLPLGGVGEIANYGISGAYDLEEALLSADDEELEEIVTETTRARLARGPIWLQGAMTLFYAMASTL